MHSELSRSGRRSICFLAALAFAASGSTALAQETFKLGGLASVTGGGASIGLASVTAWKLAVDDINAAGGILGKKVELVIGDTQSDPTHGVSEARRLIESEKVGAFVGPAVSQEVTPVVAVAKEAKIFEVTTASAPTLTPEVGPYHFSDTVTAVNQMIPNVDFALTVLKAKKIAIISDNGGMAKGGVADLTVYLKEKGITPVAVQEFPFKTEDMTPQLMALKSAEPDVVLLINSLGDDARKMLANRADLNWKVPVLANQTMTNFAVGNAKVLGKEAFEGVYSTHFGPMTYCPGDALGSSSYAKFAERAKKDVKDLEKLGGPAALTPFYVQPLIVAAAFNGAKSTDGAVVAKWLEGNADKVSLIIGPIVASEKSHFLPSPAGIKVVKNAYAQREDGLVERADCAK